MKNMPNDASNESEKILESLFEPDNAEILVELKDGPKSLSVLTKKMIMYLIHLIRKSCQNF